jgi:hypothetical protein
VAQTAEEAIQPPIFELVDAIEVMNGSNLEKEHRLAQEVAGLWGRAGTGGSDAHSVNALGKGVTVFPGDVRTQDGLLEALRAGKFFPVKGFHLGQPVEYGGNLDQAG